MENKPRIIVIDIETLPIMSKTLKVFPQLSNYPGLTLKADITSIICFGWKVLGEKRAHCEAVWDFKTRWKKDVNDDYSLCKKISEIILSADAIVSHNGKRFDWKFIQTRLAINGLPLLPKVPHIDTCSVSKSHLFMFNNRLKTLAEGLTEERKLDNDGWDLWVQVHARKRSAMLKMEKYNIGDVIATESLYKRLLPFITNIPNYNLFRRDASQVCINCGSHHVQKDGVRVSKSSKKQRYRCYDCGSNMQSNIKVKIELR